MLQRFSSVLKDDGGPTAPPSGEGKTSRWKRHRSRDWPASRRWSKHLRIWHLLFQRTNPSLITKQSTIPCSQHRPVSIKLELITLFSCDRHIPVPPHGWTKLKIYRLVNAFWPTRVLVISRTRVSLPKHRDPRTGTTVLHLHPQAAVPAAPRPTVLFSSKLSGCLWRVVSEWVFACCGIW